MTLPSAAVQVLDVKDSGCGGARNWLKRGRTEGKVFPMREGIIYMLRALVLLLSVTLVHTCEDKARGVALMSQGTFDDALVWLVRAAAGCGAADPQVYQGLGECAHAIGARADALRAYLAALRLSPSSVDLANNVAALMIEMDHPRDAIGTLTRVHARLLRAREGGHALWKTLVNLASALGEVSDGRGAAEAMRRAALVSDIPWSNQAIAEVQAFFWLRKLCDWAYDDDMAVHVALEQARGALDHVWLPVDPYLALSMRLTPLEFLAVARHYAASTYYTRPAAPTEATTTARLAAMLSSSARNHDGIVVAYACSEFGRQHSIMLLMRGVFPTHTRRVTPICFGLQHPRNGVPLPQCRGGFADLSNLNDSEAARSINKAGAHVLVDLNGWTQGGRAAVVAARPSALQVSYMGFPGTSGSAFIDLAVGDRHVTPPEYAQHFSEALALLPNTYFVSSYMHAGLPPPQGRGVNQSIDAHTHARPLKQYCNHDSHHKFDRARVGLWMRAVRSAGGTLALLRQADESDASLTMEAGRYGAPVVLEERLGVGEHMARISACAVALDTDGIGAHTTAANYLYAGVPITTLPTEHMVGRVAASLSLAVHCGAAGVVRSEGDFVRTAVKLASGHGDALRTCLRAAAQAAWGPQEGGRAHVWGVARWVEAWEAALGMMLEGWMERRTHVLVVQRP